ncbi:high affinity cGMP-specific 3',5'-cyclic phosphodiesterase 9A [Neocloeon triangulifer]|uniref:high affinity cGMP-specific 3',5'-cyclic phosphodiesterase 9A n=1 Tax=Neocloeon triangulifer TaxID=2078957 RepID=UPI00286FA63F|nr:high affinity cGMP-specific 3',5'-cyclic phosphodiesterase 9A [Neocloeon triangulifer]
MEPLLNSKQQQCSFCGIFQQEKNFYFKVGLKDEVLRIPVTIQKPEFIDMLRTAAEVDNSEILKVYSNPGHLVNISPDLPANSPDSPYELHVIATNCNDIIRRELCVDFDVLNNRISELEQMLNPDNVDVSKAITSLRKQVETFRLKLENFKDQQLLGSQEPHLTKNEKHNWITLKQTNQHRFERRGAEERLIVWHKFVKICEISVSEDVQYRLRQVNFNIYEWEDEELLMLLQQMYLDLGLMSTFALDLSTLRAFLFQVYENYNDVPFHNFRHSFCVAQMMYALIWAAGLQKRMGDLETLMLITSCICHDLDHPGYNNIYQINARTELAIRYNDISPLENHHCSIAFQILSRPECNIFKRFTFELFRQVREGIIRCILATDMARHNEILEQFREITPVFDFSNTAHTNLLSMVLIKVADISNEARPMEVAEPWLDRLLQEFFTQSDKEKLEGLPVTPFMDRDKVTKPSSQCSFIGLVLLPLFEALANLLPELHDMIIKPVNIALDYYRRLNEAARERRSLDLQLSADNSPLTDQASSPSETKRRSVSVDSNSRQGRVSIHSNSELLRQISMIEEADAAAEVTEVDICEKTLKFKISTEHTVTSLRKGSMGTSVKVSPSEDEPKCRKQSFFSKLRFFRDKCPEKDVKKPGTRRKSSSSSELNKQFSSDGARGGSTTPQEGVLSSGSLDCVLATEKSHNKKQRRFQKLKTSDGSRSPIKSKVASLVGSFRKNRRSDNLKTN